MAFPEASMISRVPDNGFTSAPIPFATAVEVIGKVHPVSITLSVSVLLPPDILEYAFDAITKVSSSLAALALYAV